MTTYTPAPNHFTTTPQTFASPIRFDFKVSEAEQQIIMQLRRIAREGNGEELLINPREMTGRILGGKTEKYKW